MKIALIQMNSSNTLKENLKKMHSFCEQAQKEHADLVVFPEMVYFTGKAPEIQLILPEFERLKNVFSNWAKELDLFLIPGTLREPVPEEPKKYFNTLICFNSQGHEVAKYRKLFLFQAKLEHHHYDESRYCKSGEEVVVCDIKGNTVGFAICFDLRFPELFRSLRKRGARIFIIPAAFTVPTGEAHWETLLRARAIENQAFVCASDQTGISGEDLPQYGHSLFVSPWGEIRGKMGTEEGMSLVTLSSQELQDCESRMAIWESRNDRVFPIA
ncbi:MAG: carbon-nitrogen hydrolase family protein [Proteobacteria bacterium]|nr:carbon-nitrogen hydrolase family protein [Pseudomonadota bacterium]NDC23061.1 carbon-nitrogen hydrolase family protein [Pseudomonadota bacterium]NDD04343.1 carbon-nitrogen hydrolase family protein [Pseudomonadota bacterium]NDG25550.1 carbon-nitrogen hydrolase family protein [Pseudomonadota bacterium]